MFMSHKFMSSLVYVFTCSIINFTHLKSTNSNSYIPKKALLPYKFIGFFL